MAAEQKQQDAQILICEARKKWPVSLLGCLGYDVHMNEDQVAWPWVLFKASVCPATVLGANETLFQGEELADVGCLQPHSCSGPFCRELNEVYCGLGNEGLKLCVNTCLLQALCSCACLGLPFVAWWTALQRQRVVAKHNVDDTDDAGWMTTAMFPCSLMQMHVLLHQQRQLQQQQQQQQQAPLKAPLVQRMTASTAAGGDCLIQAPVTSSRPGPLTSGLSTSRVLRTVRGHPGRGESALREQAASAAGSRQCDSPDCSSDTSDGVESQYILVAPTDGISPATPDLRLSAAADGKAQRSSMPTASGGLPAATAAASASAAGSPAATPRSHRNQQQQQLPGPCEHNSSRLGHCTSTSDVSVILAPAASQAATNSPRASGSNGITAGPLSQRQQQRHMEGRQQQLPPKQRHTTTKPGHHMRTMSAGAACVAAAGSSGGGFAITQHCEGPEPLCNIGSGGGGAEAADADAVVGVTQSCQLLPCHSSSSSVGVVGGFRCPAATAAVGSSACCNPEQQQQQQSGIAGSRTFAGSCSVSKLQLSHEDVPLLSLKRSPGRVPRGMSGAGLSSSRCCSLAPGSGLTSSRCASLASSLQQQQRSTGAAESVAAVDHAQGAVAVLMQQQQQQQQDDICEYNSSIGGAAVSTDLQLHGSHQVLHQQHGSSAAPAQPQQEDSNYLRGAYTASSSCSGGSGSSGGAAGKSAAAAMAGAGAPTAGPGRTADWAYMSEMCNLGGSFDGNSGLAVAMRRLATEGSNGSAGSAGGAGASRAARESTDLDSDINPLSSGSSSEAVHAPVIGKAGTGLSGATNSRGAATGCSRPGPQLTRAHHRAASGSWPDAAPSPQATLNDACGGVDATTTAAAVATPAATAAGAAGAAAAAGIARTTSGLAAAAAAADRSRCEGSIPSALSAIDRQMLAAVIGSSNTDQLTASQEELAGKLAKLAFANPAAARQLTRKPQQQQQQQAPGADAAGSRVDKSRSGGNSVWAQPEGGCETFYPTMMSDICNLAEPIDGADRASIANMWAAASAAQRSSVLRSLSVHQQQQQQQHQQQRALVAEGTPAGALTASAQRRTAAAAPGSKRSMSSVAGRSAAGKLLPPSGAATSSAAAAGPLKNGLLLHSQNSQQQQQALAPFTIRGGQTGPAGSKASRPGMARLVPGLAAGAVSNSRAAGCGAEGADNTGSDGSCSSSGGGGGYHASGPGGYPVESFDSYYPDCRLSRDFGAAGGEQAGGAGGADGSGGGHDGVSRGGGSGGRQAETEQDQGKTYTVTPGGMIMETAGVSQFEAAAATTTTAAATAAAAAAATGSGGNAAADKIAPGKQAMGLSSAALPGGAISVVSAATAAAAAAAQGLGDEGSSLYHPQEGFEGRDAVSSSRADWQVIGCNSSSCGGAASGTNSGFMMCSSGQWSPPGLVVGVRSSSGATAGGRAKGPSACTSVQTSSSLWPPPAAVTGGGRSSVADE